MIVDTYTACWNKVLLRCPSLSPKLAQDFIINAFRRIAERRRWSWLVKSGQFITPAVYSTGTVSVTLNSTTVTGVGTTFTAAMVGRQFWIGTAIPIYTIAQFNSATSIELDIPWGDATAAAQTYQIYQCLFTPPADFHQFISVWDPAFSWQLYLDAPRSDNNNVGGNCYAVSFYDYSGSQVGVVGAPVQIVGSGPDPVQGGIYTAPADSIFTITATTGGAAGTAVYKWSKNDGSYTTGVVSDVNGAAQDLQDGVVVSFPTGQTFILNDTWVIRATAISNSGVPRYMLWPYQQAAHVYPYLYEARATDLNETNAVLPRFIRGDVLVDMAMEEVCSWPGPSIEKPNPYFSTRNAERYRKNNERQLLTLERQDDETWLQDLTYSYSMLSWPYVSVLGDSAWLQSHAI